MKGGAVSDRCSSRFRVHSFEIVVSNHIGLHIESWIEPPNRALERTSHGKLAPSVSERAAQRNVGRRHLPTPVLIPMSGTITSGLKITR